VLLLGIFQSSEFILENFSFSNHTRPHRYQHTHDTRVKVVERRHASKYTQPYFEITLG
jgi:hypothetical protein